jgi:anti-anti-sigma factor
LTAPRDGGETVPRVATTGDDMTVRDRDGVTIVRFNLESLLGHDVEHLTDRIRTLIDGGVRRLVLDFKHVRYAGSAALGMAMALSKMIEGAGGKLALSHTENINELLKLTHAYRLFLIAPDAKAAVEMLNAVAG